MRATPRSVSVTGVAKVRLTAPARSVTPSRRRLGSNSVGRRCYRFPISTSPSPYPRNCGARCAGIRSTATAEAVITHIKKIMAHPLIGWVAAITGPRAKTGRHLHRMDERHTEHFHVEVD